MKPKIEYYSNRHIKDQVQNIEPNSYIILENTLSRSWWSLYFNYYKINENKLNLTYMLGEDFLKWRTDMRFHNIGGNPPYQDGQSNSQQNKIYNQITKKVMSLLTKDGVLGPWYTPISVLKKSKRFSFIGEKGLKEVDFTVNDDFDSGVRICATTLDKTYEGDVKVINSKGSTMVSPGQMIFDYTLIDEKFAKLYEKIKLLNFNSPNNRGFYYNNFGPVVSKKKTKEYKYELHKLTKTGDVELFTYLNRKPYLYGKKKLVISRTRQFTEAATVVSDKDFNVGHVFIDIDNDQEIENVKSFLFSEYFISHCQQWKTLEGYGFNDALIYLPKFDKTKHWTNEEVKEFIEGFLID